MAGRLTRRQAIAGGAVGVAAALAGGVGLVGAGVLPGRYRLARTLGACDVGVPATTVAAAGEEVAGAARLRGLAVRVDCGRDDPFVGATRALAAALPGDAEVHLAKGCHDGVFWQRQAPAQLRFLAAAFGR
jgi:hypothetical protein